MTFDYYAKLDSVSASPAYAILPDDLASGFVDECTVWSTREKEKAREFYKKRAKKLGSITPIDELKLDACIPSLLDKTWIEFEIRFELQRPWYSKDDTPFHVLDNPVRKDRVFGVLYMSATSWKGLLRWACRMNSGLFEHLEEHNGKMDDWQDKDKAWIMHLFGNEKDKTNFHKGALEFYPTWFRKIGFEVINPHSRATRAGKVPIYYEVVPAGTDGLFRLLYAPLPDAAKRDKVEAVETLGHLLDSIETLFTRYGISAKRTAGWGTAKINSWKAFKRDQTAIEKSLLSDFKDAIRSWRNSEVKAP
jgi:CRISPR-associated protein Cmr2